VRKLNSDFWDSQHIERSNYLFKKNTLSKEYSRIFSLIEINPGMTVFEIGCGDSVFLEFLVETYTISPFGLDSSPKGIELIKNRLPDYAEHFVLSDVEIYSDSSKFDLVTSFGFLEHFTDREAIWRKSYELTKNEGYCLSVVPNLSGLNYYFAKHIAKIMDWHVAIPKSILELEAKSAGYEIVESGFFGGYRLFGTPKLAPIRYAKKFANLLLHIAWSINKSNNEYLSPYYFVLCRKK
jgi:2-polyprenyl-3-methyl-5-hydroxy-6-metoxy-1,4-benzoquinol methylase